MTTPSNAPRHKASNKTLQIRHAPHLASGMSVDQIMRNVVVALLPVSAFAVYVFGLAAALVLGTAVASCVATEQMWCRARGQHSTVGDWSAVVTGLLLGLTLPPSLPLWMVAVGGVGAVGIGKLLFGGLGGNPFNPALVGRALLQAAFPVAMTTWPSKRGALGTLFPSTLTPPFCKPAYDTVSGATPLADWKFSQISVSTSDLFIGTTTGSTGETSSLLILLGGVFLIARGMMSWHIPVAILLAVAVMSSGLHAWDPARFASPQFMLLSGGLMLGAVFMATDPVGSPMTHLGCVIYGVLIGALVVVIRVWGGLPEGVMYAILIGNAVSPHIDNWVQPRAYGTGRLPHV
ncbi:MAG: RnfABCDGE type electron transport complex subunit D [Planctomycetota bacterium]|nr:RnfABCDGE type electron transport complex subunit D [Planctomycetota bacterium]